MSLAKFLRSLGVNAMHEDMQEGAVSVSWLYAADAGLYPFERPASRIFRKRLIKSMPAGERLFGPVVQLTRHPLKVMSSTRRCFCGRGDRSLPRGQLSDGKSWTFVEAHVPRIDAESPPDDLVRSALYWVEWNKLIEHRYPARTHIRLEDGEPAMLLDGLGIEGIDRSMLPSSFPVDRGHKSPEKEKMRLPDVTWRELYETDVEIAREVFALAQKYGYEQGKTSVEEAL